MLNNKIIMHWCLKLYFGKYVRKSHFITFNFCILVLLVVTTFIEHSIKPNPGHFYYEIQLGKVPNESIRNTDSKC